VTATPQPGADLFHRAVLDTVNRLRQEGWTVDVEPDREVPGLGSYRPDYVAQRGEETIIGEVKHLSQANLEELKRVVELVGTIPKARLDVTWLGSVEPTHDSQEVETLVSRARHLVAHDTGAALLMAWSALSGAMATTSILEETEDDSPKPVRQRFARMSSMGAMSDTQFLKLDEASHLRNEIAHGSVELPDPGTVEYVCVVAEAIAKNAYFSVESMIEWFLEQYEDPAVIVPYESREGGYIYYAGGPYDAEDVLRDNFDLMPEEDIQEAVSALVDTSYEWIRKADYYDQT